MCGGCGSLLYLTGERRRRRFYWLILPAFLVVGNFGLSLVKFSDGLNKYSEARGIDELNFISFLLICAAIFVVLSFLERFETVGVAAKADTEGKETATKS